MKTPEGYFYLLLIIAAIWGLLSLAPQSVLADGGGWPTATSTAIEATAQIIFQPAVSLDEFAATPTAASLQDSAPLPEAQVGGDQLLPDSGLAIPTATNSSTLPAQSNGGISRFFLAGGVLLVVILIVGFIVFRLRA